MKADVDDKTSPKIAEVHHFGDTHSLVTPQNMINRINELSRKKSKKDKPIDHTENILSGISLVENNLSPESALGIDIIELSWCIRLSEMDGLNSDGRK